MHLTASVAIREKMVRKKTRTNRHAGFAMMEVLMTIVVIAIGALGLAGLQLSSMKYNKESAVRSNATLLAIELSDRMRSNMAGVKAGSYTENNGYALAQSTLAAISAPTCGTSSDCTSAQLANLDLANWRDSLLAAMPQGTGAVVPVASNGYVYDIVVMWVEKSLADAGATDSTCPGTLAVGVRCLHTPFIP